MGRSAASGKIGEMDWGTWVSHYLVAFFFRFPPVNPPVFRHFSATCRGCSYNCESDLMMNPRFSHFPPFCPISPHFSKASSGTWGLRIRVPRYPPTPPSPVRPFALQRILTPGHLVKYLLASGLLGRPKREVGTGKTRDDAWAIEETFSCRPVKQPVLRERVLTPAVSLRADLRSLSREQRRVLERYAPRLPWNWQEESDTESEESSEEVYLTCAQGIWRDSCRSLGYRTTLGLGCGTVIGPEPCTTSGRALPPYTRSLSWLRISVEMVVRA